MKDLTFLFVTNDQALTTNHVYDIPIKTRFCHEARITGPDPKCQARLTASVLWHFPSQWFLFIFSSKCSGKDAQMETQKAAIRFERANSMHVAAKEMVSTVDHLLLFDDAVGQKQHLCFKLSKFQHIVIGQI